MDLASFDPTKSRPASVAFHIHLEDRRVVDEPINSRESHGRILEDLSPFSEGLICRYDANCRVNSLHPKPNRPW